MKATDLRFAHPSRKMVQAALCTITLGTAAVGRAEDLTDAQAPAQTAKVDSLSSAEINRSASYAIGDKLKITVFEQLQPDTREGGEQRDIVASAIERPDLSGEYIVQEDGNIYMPLTGSVAVAGSSFQELDQALSTALSGKLNGVVRVGIRLVEREPVYVLGPVARPGPYKHIPGMSVLHVLALAGAADTALQDQWRLLDTARERERLLKSSERLTRSLARLAILVTERDGAEPATKRLSDLVGPVAAKARLGEANSFREVERSKRKKQETAIAAAIQSYQTELAIQRNKLAQVESNVSDRNQRMDFINKLRERGATTDITYYASLMELGDAKERFQDAKAVIAQTEHRISDLQHEQLRITVDAEVDREREIRELQSAIDEEELTRVAVGTALAQLPGTLERQTTGRKEMSFSILRRTQWGLMRRPAQSDSLLEPGDVLQISPSQAARVATQ
ncbi:polysaccharide biosynthesis/export family protein [Methylobacterium nodulans]|uniref:Polysaccharide export protein n=1 Tax=Methylobacterium nodulans (strain LMG 21967 / CNCM I-2342 / ORS 2060) TaxID=460265 RepID=B8II96_METNO|nr:polysaccharide biosynthesis/export family protein [Methylobacterium nodulans]ACL57965.1 polysaccharide export protein [Methylobacterium nodulans ORS 2060]